MDLHSAREQTSGIEFNGLAVVSRPYERKLAASHFDNEALPCYFPTSLA